MAEIGAGRTIGPVATGHRVRGGSKSAPFSLAIHRSEGMALLAMNWRRRRPPEDFVGFGIRYFPPGSTRALNVTNRLSFAGTPPPVRRQPSMKAPIQKFRWIHFPADAEKPGAFRYVVTPMFMDADDRLHPGDAQEAALELSRETFPGAVNVAFTRGFVSSQAFVDRFQSAGPINTLLPPSADQGLTFVPTHPKAAAALEWMGFEARRSVLELLDQAIADPTATVRVVAYDLSEGELVGRLERLGDRLRIIIDDSKDHGEHDSGESQAAERLLASAGPANVKRQHMGNLQHNKTIVVTGPNVQKAVCGSTNFSWRGFFVQNNNAVVLTGAAAVAPFADAFERYFAGGPTAFGRSPSADWIDLQLKGVDAQVTFSPHGADKLKLAEVAADIASARSSVLYSLAFLHQTGGAVRQAITAVTENPAIFVAGIADKAVGGINVQTPNGNVAPVFPAALTHNVPVPFSKEPTGGGGIRMHHKFVVIDFDKPTARVYFGSYNFSGPADKENGENLIRVRDRRIATAYAVEAVRIFDHYEFRVKQQDADTAQRELRLRKPPRAAGEVPWFAKDFKEPHRILDRKLFV